MIKAETLWTKVKNFLLNYSGSLTEIFILDIPLSDIRNTLEVFKTYVKDIHIVVINNLQLDEPAKLNDSIFEIIERKTENDTMHKLIGKYFTECFLQCYILVNGELQTFDIELVFANDMSFPKKESEKNNFQTFVEFLNLTYNLKNNNTFVKCILSDEHNGDPRELLSDEDLYVLL